MHKNYKEYKIMFMLPLLLASTFSLYAMDHHKTSAYSQLMQSAYENKIKRVRELLSQHTTLAQNTSVTQWGIDPLGWAAHHGNIEMAQLLLQKGFQLRANLEEGSSPLHTAAYHGAYEVLELLVTYPYCLDDADLAKLKQDEEEGELVHILTRRHFQFIRTMLESKTQIIGALMTPYEAACELPDPTCRDLLEPEGLYARLSARVSENYETGLKKRTDGDN